MQTWMNFMQEMQNPELTDEQRTRQMKAMWLEEWMPLSFANQEIVQESLDRIFGSAEFSWSHAQYSQQEHPEFDARDQLPLITARSLVISGGHDMMPVSKGEEMAAGIPGAQLVVFEDSGHYAPAEEPEAFEDLVFGFLGVN
jgi:pimeloyl-ACP methyl ester carboxylesterase